MRERILMAARSGQIEALREAIEWNEIRPETEAPAGVDLIDHWRRSSHDGQGRTVLAVLAGLLEQPYAVRDAGRPGEQYVWPALAELPLDRLSPADEVRLDRLVPQAEAKAMRETGRWTYYRLMIGRDGTWHSFLKAR